MSTMGKEDQAVIDVHFSVVKESFQPWGSV